MFLNIFNINYPMLLIIKMKKTIIEVQKSIIKKLNLNIFHITFIKSINIFNRVSTISKMKKFIQFRQFEQRQ